MTTLDRSNVHLLLVEDNPRYLGELIDWLEEEFGYKHIETARNVDEAKSKLDEKPFDVIVADMRLDEDTAGGFAVLHEKVTERNISSVIIILTANDAVADCRRAFKEGAWDYLAKGMKGNVFEVLDQSILEAITYFNLRGDDKDEEWIEQNMTQLRDKYEGKYIAVINNDVIADAETEEALIQQLRDKKYPIFMPIIRKIEAQVQPDISIHDLIKEGESATLEFKSTLQWDVRQKKRNDDLRFEVLKTITAFLNTEGGTLLIGVEDKGNIFGLERDISMVKGKNLDGFQLHLMNLINRWIGSVFSRQLKIRFEEIDDKQVCAVEVKRGLKYAFMTMKKKGEPEEKLFYIRSGNGSCSLDIEETAEYIKMSWK